MAVKPTTTIATIPKISDTAIVFKPKKLVAKKPKNRNHFALPSKIVNNISPIPTAGNKPPITLKASSTGPLNDSEIETTALEPKYRIT